MRSSVVRSFRRAATLCAAALIGAWIGVSQGLAEARELARFQLDGEERKKAVREPTLCVCLHPICCRYSVSYIHLNSTIDKSAF